MYMKVTLEEFHDSQDAIREYISHNSQNRYAYEARVTVKEMGKLFIMKQ